MTVNELFRNHPYDFMMCVKIISRVKPWRFLFRILYVTLTIQSVIYKNNIDESHKHLKKKTNTCIQLTSGIEENLFYIDW